MSYVPNNTQMFLAAFSSAVAGMGASGRLVSDPETADYDGLMQTAGAFAQSFDTEWADTPSNELTIEMAQQLCETTWQDRAPSIGAPFNEPSNYTQLSQALVAMIKSGVGYVEDQGINPNPSASSCCECAVLTATTEEGVETSAQLKLPGNLNFTAEDGFSYYLFGKIIGGGATGEGTLNKEFFAYPFLTENGVISSVGGKQVISGNDDCTIEIDGLQLIVTVPGSELTAINYQACFEWVKVAQPPAEEPSP